MTDEREQTARIDLPGGWSFRYDTLNSTGWYVFTPNGTLIREWGDHSVRAFAAAMRAASPPAPDLAGAEAVPQTPSADEQARALDAIICRHMTNGGPQVVANVMASSRAILAAGYRLPSSRPAGSEAMAVGVLRRHEWGDDGKCMECGHDGWRHGRRHAPGCEWAEAMHTTAPPDGGEAIFDETNERGYGPRETITRLVKETTPGTAQGVVVSPLDGGRPLPFTSDQLGRFVREAWVRWAQSQPAPKPTWLVPYEALSEHDKEADRQIGEAVARWTLIGAAASEAARLRTASPAGAATDPQGETDPRHALLLADAKARAAGKDLDGSERRETVEEQFDRMGAERSIANTKLHVPPAPASVTDEIAMVVLNIFDPEWRSEPSALNNLRMMKGALTAVWPTTQPTAMQETAEADVRRKALEEAASIAKRYGDEGRSNYESASNDEKAYHLWAYQQAYAIERDIRRLIDTPATTRIGETHTIEHDGFTGTVVGHYRTREGKPGVVLQQVGTRVVHVYGEKWLKRAASPAQPETEGGQP